jgi:hypothetical protein
MLNGRMTKAKCLEKSTLPDQRGEHGSARTPISRQQLIGTLPVEHDFDPFFSC